MRYFRPGGLLALCALGGRYTCSWHADAARGGGDASDLRLVCLLHRVGERCGGAFQPGSVSCALRIVSLDDGCDCRCRANRWRTGDSRHPKSRQVQAHAGARYEHIALDPNVRVCWLFSLSSHFADIMRPIAWRKCFVQLLCGWICTFRFVSKFDLYFFCKQLMQPFLVSSGSTWIWAGVAFPGLLLSCAFFFVMLVFRKKNRRVLRGETKNQGESDESGTRGEESGRQKGIGAIGIMSL
jgi:hypothetical protein